MMVVFYMRRDRFPKQIRGSDWVKATPRQAADRVQPLGTWLQLLTGARMTARLPEGRGFLDSTKRGLGHC